MPVYTCLVSICLVQFSLVHIGLGVGQKRTLGIRYRGLFGKCLIYYRVGGSSEGPFDVGLISPGRVKKYVG
jgi:hypothetical protein